MMGISQLAVIVNSIICVIEMKTFTKTFFHKVLGFLCAAVVVVYDSENIFTISSICCNGQYEFQTEETLTLYSVI
jgi:hypothetical protein